MLVTSVKAVDGEVPPPPPDSDQEDAESELAQEAHHWAQHHKKSRLVDPPPVLTPTSNKSTRRLIKVDFSALPMDDEEEEEEEEVEDEDRRAEEGGRDEEDRVDCGLGAVPGAVAGDDQPPRSLAPSAVAGAPSSNRWQRTGSRLSQAEIHEYFDSALQSYDLATQCPWAGRGCGGRRRHTVVVCQAGSKGSLSLPHSRPQSRPHSRQTDTPSEESIATTLPEMTWSRSSLQDDLLHSKQWQEECLSLTLEEIVHIRSVLTKAELESLPVEGHVKEDAEKRKVCFLCMKTRFGIFGPWGQVCKLCKRTVCAKCYSKMRIPTEHFSHVPVVALSPNLLSPCDSEDSFPKALVTKLMSSGGSQGGGEGSRSGVGSAPASPKINRSAPPSHMSTSLISDGPISLPSSSPAYTPSDKWRLAREKALGRRGREKAEKLKGLQMTVCHDCKTMVLQIIKSSRTTRNNAIRNLTLDLSPVY